MAFFPKSVDKLKSFKKPAILIYPILVIIAIPLLLALNTIWNLRSFNRDVNFIIRHQAISIADTLKPFLEDNLNDPQKVYTQLKSVTDANADIISATILVQKNNELDVFATTSPSDATQAEELGLNQLALGFNQPFAGLSYDAETRKNVWNVTVPLNFEENNTQLLFLKIKTDVVDEILARTSRDSFIILSILIIVTLILLANHFIFYKKALKTEQLQEIDRLKDEFISMAAHELRSPITGLVGYLSLLSDKIPGNAKAVLNPEIATLNRLTDDLRNLINDLLDVSRIEQGRLKVEYSQTKVNEVIKNVIETLAPVAAQKGLTISFAPTPVQVFNSDPSRLRQVLTNLISNSIKYTLKGEVRVEAREKTKHIEIKISDTGIGIPPDELPNLFSKFHRVKDRQTPEVRGTGLGLWITKELVETLGGKIYAESIYGTGSVFTVTLPLTTK